MCCRHGAIPFADPSARRARAGRTVTVLAVGFLLLDATLLGVLAVWDGRLALLGWSVTFVALAVGVLVLRRRYRQRLQEIARARTLLRQELRALTPPEQTRDAR